MVISLKLKQLQQKLKSLAVLQIINASTVVKNGWESNIGFLNDELQRVQDGLYYQNFSYSLKSRIDYDTWDNACKYNESYCRI